MSRNGGWQEPNGPSATLASTHEDDNASRHAPALSGIPSASKGPGSYDVRAGAQSYSQIVGTVGGFAVTAVVLVFTIAPSKLAAHPSEFSMATGFLALGLVGCLLAAFSLAAIGAEREPTANLPAAVMYVGGATVIALTAILAAFEALASVLLPGSTELFALIVGGGALAGVAFNSFSVADAFYSGPDDPAWLATQWIDSRIKGDRVSLELTGVSAVAVAVAVGLHLAGVRISLSQHSANVLVIVGIVLAIAGPLSSLLRTRHPIAGHSKGLTAWEAWLIQAVTCGYLAFMIICLP